MLAIVTASVAIREGTLTGKPDGRGRCACLSLGYSRTAASKALDVTPVLLCAPVLRSPRTRALSVASPRRPLRRERASRLSRSRSCLSRKAALREGGRGGVPATGETSSHSPKNSSMKLWSLSSQSRNPTASSRYSMTNSSHPRARSDIAPMSWETSSRTACSCTASAGSGSGNSTPTLRRAGRSS